MPRGLHRFQQSECLHFITFSCYHRQQRLDTPSARRIFECKLELVRRWYGLYVAGYVVMPEHVHILLSEPERRNLAIAIQMLKQNTAKELGNGTLWQKRYYDFPVWTEKKRVQKLQYMHRNPVKRGLVARPGDWQWSSFRHYATGEEGIVEIESEWTARRHEALGLTLRVKQGEVVTHPVAQKTRATRVGQPKE